MKTTEITPSRLLSTWELKEYVEKHSPPSLKPHFESAFKKGESLLRQGLRISNICTRGNIQTMLDNLDDEDMINKFKEIYP